MVLICYFNVGLVIVWIGDVCDEFFMCIDCVDINVVFMWSVFVYILGYKLSDDFV